MHRYGHLLEIQVAHVRRKGAGTNPDIAHVRRKGARTKRDVAHVRRNSAGGCAHAHLGCEQSTSAVLKLRTRAQLLGPLSRSLRTWATDDDRPPPFLRSWATDDGGPPPFLRACARPVDDEMSHRGPG